MFKKLFTAFVVAASFAAFSPNANAAAADGVNLRFSPLGLIYGSLNANVDFNTGTNWSLGAMGRFWNSKSNSDSGFQSKYSDTAYSLGLRATWYHNGTFTDGMYVAPSVSYLHSEVKSTDSNGRSVEGSRNTPIVGVLVGYGWFWDSFNIMLGIGVDRSLGEEKTTIKDSSGVSHKTTSIGSGLDGEFSFGFTF